MSIKDSTILARLEQLTNNAYAPYSGVKISVLIRDEFDDLHPGINIENAAYPMGWCAEASALSHLLTSGSKSVYEIWIFRYGTTLTTPCGGCRQKFIEFAKPSCVIHCWTSSGIKKDYLLKELMPFTFSKKNLEVK